MTLGSGAVVFARIAAELNARRPEIPLLVVEGRGAAGGLARVKLDLSACGTCTAAQPPQPAGDLPDHAGVAGAVADARVVRAGGAGGAGHGIPVLASDRGACPDPGPMRGSSSPIPERYTPASDGVPTAREVAPWVATIERALGRPGVGGVAPGSGGWRRPGGSLPTSLADGTGVLRVARP